MPTRRCYVCQEVQEDSSFPLLPGVILPTRQRHCATCAPPVAPRGRPTRPLPLAEISVKALRAEYRVGKPWKDLTTTYQRQKAELERYLTDFPARPLGRPRKPDKSVRPLAPRPTEPGPAQQRWDRRNENRVLAETGQKRCSGCRQVMPLEAFARKRQNGRRCYCLTCDNARIARIRTGTKGEAHGA